MSKNPQINVFLGRTATENPRGRTNQEGNKMANFLNEMSTDIEPADKETVIRSFDRRLRKLRSKHLLLRGKHWRTIRYHKGLLRDNHRKLHAVETYAKELLKGQSPIRQGVGHLLMEMVSSDSDSKRTD